MLVLVKGQKPSGNDTAVFDTNTDFTRDIVNRETHAFFDDHVVSFHDRRIQWTSIPILMTETVVEVLSVTSFSNDFMTA